MAGTKEGGQTLILTMIAKFGSREAWIDHQRKLGREGGKASNTGGFAYSKRTGQNWHVEAGRKGGRISTRRGVKDGEHRQERENQDSISEVS